MILVVAIDTPLRRVFDYREPAGVASDTLQPGHRVWVPFGRRRVVGVVVERREHTDVPAAKLRSALSAIDNEATFEPTLLQLLTWAADYYRHPIGEVLAAALPAGLRRGVTLRETLIYWQLTDAGREAIADIPARAVRMRKVMEYLHVAGAVSQDTLSEEIEDGVPTARKLEARGHVESFVRATDALPAATATRPKPVLNADQQAAVERIRAALGSFTSLLLYGITGSGKTEVYLQAIEAVIAREQQALVLVPEIALTPQLVARFRHRFETPIAVMHSGLTDTERLAAWRSAQTGTARIVIGTRSSVFVPLPRPGLIVIDEEHDASFKQQEGFRYSARDLAIVRAQRHGIPIVLGSATPALETLARARRQPETLLSLPHRAANAAPPTLALVDMRQFPGGHGIATPTVHSMQRHLAAGNQVLLFLNRRGFAPVLFCPACGWSAHCARCDAHLTVHLRGRSLACHHCGAGEPAPPECPNCAAPLKPVGQGTQRIEDVIATLFPTFPLARIDRDSVRHKGELEATLALARSNEVRVLIGTQMLTKGHDFPNVTLVVVLHADQGLFSSDFRASERLAQTIVQVAGRAGRADKAGEVLIQTQYPEHPLLRMLLEGGYDTFATGALAERERAGWPPYSRLALLRAEASTPAAARDFLLAVKHAAHARADHAIRLLGPAAAPMERRAGRYRAQLLVQAGSHAPLQRFLHGLLPSIEALPDAKRVRWSIDVDPLELF
jgi:primosomal protein N' (replication factor Y)